MYSVINSPVLFQTRMSKKSFSLILYFCMSPLFNNLSISFCGDTSADRRKNWLKRKVFASLLAFAFTCHLTRSCLANALRARRARPASTLATFPRTSGARTSRTSFTSTERSSSSTSRTGGGRRSPLSNSRTRGTPTMLCTRGTPTTTTATS
jgi:hypothetical protein